MREAAAEPFSLKVKGHSFSSQDRQFPKMPKLPCLLFPLSEGHDLRQEDSLDPVTPRAVGTRDMPLPWSHDHTAPHPDAAGS